MKTYLLMLALAVLVVFRGAAQVAVQITTDQDEFLPGEAVPLSIHITNSSGQRMHFGDDPNWLTFSVESVDGGIVSRNSQVPVMNPFDLESSQEGTMRVDIEPYFVMDHPGRYKVTATLNLKQWGTQLASKSKSIDVISGVKLWSADFGVPTAGGPPEMRRFALEEANFLREQLRLYVQVSDSSETHLYKVIALGPMVAFGQPAAQVDRFSHLHVLWQTGGQTFSYAIVNEKGELLKRNTYDNFTSRPQLTVNDSGDVVVVGGTRRPEPGELPLIRMPDAPTAPGPVPPTAPAQ
jgi:hypothetical protein